MVHDYQAYSAHISVCKEPLVISSLVWCRPMSGWYKVNFNAYVPDYPIRGLGVVIRDDLGSIIVAVVRLAWSWLLDFVMIRFNWRVILCLLSRLSRPSFMDGPLNTFL